MADEKHPLKIFIVMMVILCFYVCTLIYGYVGESSKTSEHESSASNSNKLSDLTSQDSSDCNGDWLSTLRTKCSNQKKNDNSSQEIVGILKSRSNENGDLFSTPTNSNKDNSKHLNDSEAEDEATEDAPILAPMPDRHKILSARVKSVEDQVLARSGYYYFDTQQNFEALLNAIGADRSDSNEVHYVWELFRSYAAANPPLPPSYVGGPDKAELCRDAQRRYEECEAAAREMESLSMKSSTLAMCPRFLDPCQR